MSYTFKAESDMTQRVIVVIVTLAAVVLVALASKIAKEERRRCIEQDAGVTYER